VKKRVLNILKTVWVSALCLVVFVAGGYFYLDNANKPTEIKQENVPYRQLPENCGILVESESGKTLFYMDFETESLKVVGAEEITLSAVEFGGYPVNYRLNTDYIMLEGFVDRLGGIDIEIESETLNYSGAQVSEIIKYNTVPTEIYRSIIKGLVERIANSGIATADLVFIIENSATDLEVGECYFWAEYMKNMCSNAVFVY
jgi:hypothetical protein